MAKKNLVLLGVSGNSLDILEMCKSKYNVMGFLDDAKSLHGTKVNGIKVLGALQNASKMTNVFFINGIGSPNSYLLKSKIIASLKIPSNRYETFVHPSSVISANAKIGIGTVIYPLCFLGAQAVVGNQVLVLSNSIVNHNVHVEDYTCIASGAALSGGVHVGQSCYIGAKAVVKEYTKIGQGSMVGMGAVVIKDVPAKQIHVGTPAALLRKIKL